MIPLHPQVIPGEPGRLRWVTAPGVVPFTGPVAVAPPALAALLDDGTLADVRLDPTAVTTTLGTGRSWGHAGPRVRTAVHQALEHPRSWVPREPSPGGAGRPSSAGGGPHDTELAAAVRELVDGPVGVLAASHGGGIELVDVHEGVVHVRLAGACHGCPAAPMTLRGRLEAELRHLSGFRGIVAADGPVRNPSRPGPRTPTARRGLPGRR